MATLSELMMIAGNGDFQNKVKYSVQKAAIAVMAEAGSVTAHAQRVAYAKAILGQIPLNDTSTHKFDLYEYAVGFVTNPTIAAQANINSGGFGIPDGDFDFVVNSLYNAYAGVAN